MKLKFKIQEFQTNAVKALISLFKGQEKEENTFSLLDKASQYSLIPDQVGFGNKLLIDNQTLIANLHAVQRSFSLPQTQDEVPSSSESTTKPLHFSIEMETGTGKTYVYIQTILELHKVYGFTKFIIVVPSVAIREGVQKSFEITKSHFATLYNNIPYHVFTYNSSKLSEVRQFATSSHIEIMIINIDAFKKSENIINQEQDKLNGESAMYYIKQSNPIVIIDEPQSVDNTPKAKEAIANLNPLCVLRYSATHREKTNLIYRLTPVDAYQMGLVKQVSVISNSIINDANKAYIALKSVSHTNGFSAKIEIDVEDTKGKTTRKTISVKTGDDLFIKSGHRELYDGYVIEDIECAQGREKVTFSNTESVSLKHALGAIDDNIVKRAQIYHTIKTHFDKELRYMEKNIKVLSLFFIDEVKKYRNHDTNDEEIDGIYATMFEECYTELMADPRYAPLKEKFHSDVKKAHNGYFSKDKKGILKNTKGDTQADDDTYNTIMRDKEWLLSFNCPLRFIFSHSALKEGWDNPNVFQVCTLLEQKSLFTCRQKIGRGLRLCVDQEGERIEDKDINILHVIANESFAEFAEKLQKEIESETGLKFGILELSNLIGLTYQEEYEIEKSIHAEEAKEIITLLQQQGSIDSEGTILKKSPNSSQEKENKTENTIEAEKNPIKIETVFFSSLSPALISKAEEVIQECAQKGKNISHNTLINTSYTEKSIQEKSIDYKEASEILESLQKEDIIAKNGKIKDTMKAQLQAGTLDLSQRWSKAKQRAILQALEKANNKPLLRDASKEINVRMKKTAILSPEFLALWDKIKQKTTYQVNFDLEQLIANSIRDIADMPSISAPKLLTQNASLDIAKEGVLHKENSISQQTLKQDYAILPDILQLIATQTLLKRTTVNRILQESGRAFEFLINPQVFYEQCLEIIERNRHNLAIDGIKYIKLDHEEYYVQEIFNTAELLANLEKNALPVQNSLYDHIVYDSNTECSLARALDDDPDVKMYFKIPSRFKIETPIGSYNPDWAVYLEQEGAKKLYFVLESKGSTNAYDLRLKEELKIRCGKAHFKALENDIQFSTKPLSDWKTFKSKI